MEKCNKCGKELEQVKGKVKLAIKMENETCAKCGHKEDLHNDKYGCLHGKRYNKVRNGCSCEKFEPQNKEDNGHLTDINGHESLSDKMKKLWKNYKLLTSEEILYEVERYHKEAVQELKEGLKPSNNENFTKEYVEKAIPRIIDYIFGEVLV